MVQRRTVLKSLILACPWIAATSTGSQLWAQAGSDGALRRTLKFREEEREYFVRLPDDFDPDKLYWPLVVVHGGRGSGRTFFMAEALRREADELGLDAIVVAPTFPSLGDHRGPAFPSLGEGEFLELILEELRSVYRMRPKMLLTGYSRGGQFSHRFAFQMPQQVEAVAPFASGTWTTPDGRLLIESFGEVTDPSSFLADGTNARAIPERLGDMFEPRFARVAGLKAKAGAKDIPFLVMCGALDPRLSIAKEFSHSLEAEGYMVQTEWPHTPHVGWDKDPDEFAKYSRRAVEFFVKHTAEA